MTKMRTISTGIDTSATFRMDNETEKLHKQFYCEHAEIDNEDCFRNVSLGTYRNVMLCELCWKAFAFSVVERLISKAKLFLTDSSLTADDIVAQWP
ncbi:MAG: hypothetical protein GWN94_17680 [Phycisphaerae bacterium]|nr:hypothetical protein [Phycisphaerae bacterium]